jgi:hypothetical protein
MKLYTCKTTSDRANNYLFSKLKIIFAGPFSLLSFSNFITDDSRSFGVSILNLWKLSVFNFDLGWNKNGGDGIVFNLFLLQHYNIFSISLGLFDCYSTISFFDTNV